MSLLEIQVTIPRQSTIIATSNLKELETYQKEKPNLTADQVFYA